MFSKLCITASYIFIQEDIDKISTKRKNRDENEILKS